MRLIFITVIPHSTNQDFLKFGEGIDYGVPLIDLSAEELLSDIENA
jgi:hypothetical protein